MTATGDIEDHATRAATSDGARTAVRVGWLAKAVVYAVLAWIVLQLAFGSPPEDASTTGALEHVAGGVAGTVALVLLGLGLLAYAAGRILEVTVLAQPDIDRSDQVQGAVFAVVYTAMALTAFGIAGLAGGGGGGGGGQAEQEGTSFLLGLPGGQVLVSAVGVAVVAVGARVAWQGVRRDFLPTLRTSAMPARLRDVVGPLGTAAFLARGAIFVFVGIFLVQAALAYDPDDGVGVDGALRRVAEQPWGTAALVAIAVGLLAYGTFCAVEARYRRLGSAAGSAAS